MTNNTTKSNEYIQITRALDVRFKAEHNELPYLIKCSDGIHTLVSDDRMFLKNTTLPIFIEKNHNKIYTPLVNGIKVPLFSGDIINMYTCDTSPLVYQTRVDIIRTCHTLSTKNTWSNMMTEMMFEYFGCL